MEVIHDHLAQGPNVLACDGALATCLDNGIVPDGVVGDMDSVNGDVLERFVRLGGKSMSERSKTPMIWPKPWYWRANKAILRASSSVRREATVNMSGQIS